MSKPSKKKIVALTSLNHPTIGIWYQARTEPSHGHHAFNHRTSRGERLPCTNQPPFQHRHPSTIAPVSYINHSPRHPSSPNQPTPLQHQNTRTQSFFPPNHRIQPSTSTCAKHGSPKHAINSDTHIFKKKTQKKNKICMAWLKKKTADQLGEGGGKGAHTRETTNKKTSRYGTYVLTIEQKKEKTLTC